VPKKSVAYGLVDAVRILLSRAGNFVTGLNATGKCNAIKVTGEMYCSSDAAVFTAHARRTEAIV
jgi:hypothetical protein